MAEHLGPRRGRKSRRPNRVKSTSGDLLVNGVLASSYTSIHCLGGFGSVQLLQWLSHGTMTPCRLCCAMKSGCHDESCDEMNGLNPWVSLLSGLQRTLLNSSVIGKTSIVLVGAVPFVFFVILGCLPSTALRFVDSSCRGTGWMFFVEVAFF